MNGVADACRVAAGTAMAPGNSGTDRQLAKGPRMLRWSRPDVRVALLTGLMGASTVALVVTLVGHHSTPIRWWLLLALTALFAITEGFVVHLRVRRGAHAISFAEIPMVFAPLTVDPVLAIAERAGRRRSFLYGWPSRNSHRDGAPRDMASTTH